MGKEEAMRGATSALEAWLEQAMTGIVPRPGDLLHLVNIQTGAEGTLALGNRKDGVVLEVRDPEQPEERRN